MSAAQQRRRDAELAALNLRAQRCQRGNGGGKCNTLLETHVGEFGRTIVTCPACERRKRGICRECPRPVAGQVGKAVRCTEHKELAKREQERACNERHAEAYREKYREYYHRPDVNARRNEYKRAWRKAHPEEVRAQKQRYIEKHRADPNSRYIRYHAKYREKYRLQKRELERERLARNPEPRKTAPKCTRCGKSTRWKPIPHGNSGRPWMVCTPCLFPCERKVRMRNRRRAIARAKEWEASIPKKVKRPPRMAERGPGWERTCITPGCDIVVTHRKKKCTKCRRAAAAAAAAKLAAHQGRGRRTDLERVA